MKICENRFINFSSFFSDKRMISLLNSEEFCKGFFVFWWELLGGFVEFNALRKLSEIFSNKTWHFFLNTLSDMFIYPPFSSPTKISKLFLDEVQRESTLFDNRVCWRFVNHYLESLPTLPSQLTVSFSSLSTSSLITFQI